jgi:hypothetical protein
MIRFSAPGGVENRKKEMALLGSCDKARPDRIERVV